MIGQYETETAKSELKRHEDDLKNNNFSWFDKEFKSDRASITAFLIERGIDVLKFLDKLYNSMFYKVDKDKFKRIVIPKNIQSVEENAFSGSAFEEIIFDNNKIKQLPPETFSGLSNLKKIVLPRSLKIIPKDCFRYCSSLQELEIPDSVDFIGKNAFNGCDENLKIIANFRSMKKIKAPKTDMEFLKAHVTFNHEEENDEIF